MDVVFLSPAHPPDMPLFVRGLTDVGARVVGVGDQPAGSLPDLAARSLAGYLQIPGWADEDTAVAAILDGLKGRHVDRVETLWESTMLVAARLRETIGLPGLTVEQTRPFRDKGRMKDVVQAAGVRVPRAVRATTVAGVREAAEQIGYPLIVKPIAGAGSMDTYRIDQADDLEEALPRLRHVPEVSVEEFVDGEELTFDTVCAGGQIAFFNICWYRPRPLVGKQLEWISPQVVALRDVGAPALAGGNAMGHAVIGAMGVEAGFTHMEWYRTADGEAVFGEIGARAPGGRLTDLMNFSCDIDLYRGWAEAVCHGRFSQPVERRFNVAEVIKRAEGQGRITHVEGLDHLMAELGEHIVNVDLVPIGHPRRDWTATVLSDGIVVVRHPDLTTTLEMADRIATELRVYAA